MTNVITLPTIFKFGIDQIRVVLIDGAPWFVAGDVCKALQLTNASMSLKALDDDEISYGTVETLGGRQEAALVSESGMYTLVLRCRDAVKKGTVPHRFRKWVTAEVIPAIRKTGTYAVTATPDIPLLISSQQQTELERAVHDLATLAGSKGQNYRSVCMQTWRDLRKQFGLREYAQLPAERFQEAIDFVIERRAEWEVVDGVAGYTMENFMDMMHDFYLGGQVPQRVEVELARQLLMRMRDAIVETKLQIGGHNITDPEVRRCVNNARKILSRRSLSVPLEPWHNRIALNRRAAA